MNNLYKEITIEIYCIAGSLHGECMILTKVTGRVKKRVLLFFTKTYEEEVICQAESDYFTIKYIKDYLKKGMVETTGTDNLFPNKFKFVSGYDSGQPDLLKQYYPTRKLKLQEKINTQLKYWNVRA